MSHFSPFRYRSLEDIQAEFASLGIQIPISDDFSHLLEPVNLGQRIMPNRFVVQPMEGCDCLDDGSPGELVYRRYRRFSAGGAGMIWFEACAVVPNGRANPRQMMLTEKNLPKFKQLVAECHEAATESLGANHRPLLILQLTHSGRYSRPEGVPAPIIAHHSPILDPKHNLPKDYPLITDDELQQLQEAYLKTAHLALEAGFDGVDVKACHGYLLAELLGAFTRVNSRFGGPEFNDRTRMVQEIHRRISEECPDLIVSSRLNAYDSTPHPYGWGNVKTDFTKMDLTEPVHLATILKEQGAPCINITIGNPYYLPHFNRPFDDPISGFTHPDEHPLEGVNRLLLAAKGIQEGCRDLKTIGSGFSYLREFLPHYAAGLVRDGWVSLIGVGRGSLAYPDYVKDLMNDGKMNPLKTCIACSSCTQIMRDGGMSGCVIRDSSVYGPIFREGRRWARESIIEKAKMCRECVAPTCQAGCPSGVDIPAFVGAVIEEDFPEAYKVLKSSNLLPEICSFVCPVEVQCEGNCIQSVLTGEPVPIRDIQRFVCRVAREEGWAELTLPKKTTKWKVAVIGGGASGLGCAMKLLELGHRVTIFESSESLGGIGRQTIPSHRLADEDVEKELLALISTIDKHRLEIRTGSVFGKEFSLDDLFEQGFDRIFLALGLMGTTSILPESEKINGVESGLDFLRRMKKDPSSELPETVAVLGGGNTAIDAAVTAKLHGAQDVYLIYRRSFEEMPAWPREREKAMATGVHFLILSQPTGYETNEKSKVTGVRLSRTVLGKADESGRRRPVIVPNSESTLKVGLIVEALGQKSAGYLSKVLPGVSFTKRGLISVNPDTMQTSREKVYGGGDMVNGGSTIARSVAEGMKAAMAIDENLKKEGA